MSGGNAKYKNLLDKLDQLTQNDPEFKKELGKRYGGGDVVKNDISKNIEEIRDILRIKGRQSIDYSFIPNEYQMLRDTLVIDNIRMENFRLDLKLNEFERFYNFCTNAFFQIENLLNYYYYRRFPDFDDFIEYLKNIPRSSYEYKKEHKSISDIPIATKIYSFNIEKLPHPDYNNKKYNQDNFNIDNLRKIRNEGFHRCLVVQTNEKEDTKLYNFFKYQTFDTIRNTIVNIIEIIKVL